jgi:hypothetical protein
MKIDRLDAHDRLIQLKKQSSYITEGCEACIRNRPLSYENYPFYIYAHARTDDDGATKRLIWEPRLTKPDVDTNSMLFMAYPPSDKIKIIWMIPSRELWKQYQTGNVTEHNVVWQSIYDYRYNKKKLMIKDPDEISEERKIKVMLGVAKEKMDNDAEKENRKINKLITGE